MTEPYLRTLCRVIVNRVHNNAKVVILAAKEGAKHGPTIPLDAFPKAVADHIFREQDTFLWVMARYIDNPSEDGGPQIDEDSWEIFEWPEGGGSHTTHCCVEHGCKYCDRDCPIETGEIPQYFACYDCDEVAFYQRQREQGLAYDEVGVVVSEVEDHQEEWRPIPGHPRYLVSDQGRVAKLMKPRETELGYLRVGLTTRGEITKRFVHHWVLEAFVGPKPPDCECRHLDGNPTNNRFSNLQWGTASENARDKIRHGTMPMGEDHPLAVLTTGQVAEARRRYRKGERNVSALSQEYPCSNVSLRKAIFGETRRDADYLEPPVEKDNG
jgi:hypothetical protein